MPDPIDLIKTKFNFPDLTFLSPIIDFLNLVKLYFFDNRFGLNFLIIDTIMSSISVLSSQQS